MVCFHPIEGYRAPGGQVVFAKRHGWSDLEIKIPCGQCKGCRLEKSRQWAMRIMHESTLYPENCFLTLTYSDEELPENGSLKVRDHQLFLKRLRKKFPRQIRFYHCGEYGDETHRPHYHDIIFNLDFEDKVFLKLTKTGQPLYTSVTLDALWGHGDCYIGDVTFESAAYCGRYVMKKLTGSRKSEYGCLEPEYSTMSRRPGIGAPWLKKWKEDVYPHDFCVFNGKRVRVPKFYDNLVEDSPFGRFVLDEHNFPIWMPSIKRTESEKRKGSRIRKAAKHADDNTPERLAVREEVLLRRLEQLKRS